MTDRDALLAAIAAHPDEDTPRLLYADWLTENGEPERGEFVRAQCRLAEMRRVYDPVSPLPGGHPAHAEYAALVRWERDWWRDHSPAVFANRGGLGPVDTATPCGACLDLGQGRTVGHVFFRRGFPDLAKFTLADFMGGPCGGQGCTLCGGEDRDYHTMCPGCSVCSGSGTLPGVAGSLLAACPLVTRIVLSDREPASGWQVWGDTQGAVTDHVWARENEPDDGGPYVLPVPLWDALIGFTSADRWWKRFPARGTALDALSAACITHTRRFADPTSA